MTEKRRRYEDSYNPVIDIPLQPVDEAREADSADSKVEKAQRIAKATPRRVSRKKPRPSEDEKKKKPSAQSEADGKSWFESLRDALKSQTCRWIVGIVLGSIAAYTLVCFLSYLGNCVSDQAAISNTPVGSLPQVGNAGGEGGARMAEFLINESYGLGSFVIILWLFAIASKLLCGWPKFKTVNFTIKCIVAFITVSLIIGLLTISLNSPVNWGGYHGRYVNEFIIGFSGWIGAVILCLMLVAIFIVICLRDLVNWIIRKRKAIAERRRIAAEEKAERQRREKEIEEMRIREQQDAIKSGETSPENQQDDMPSDSLVTFGGNEVDIDPTIAGYDLDEDSEEKSGLATKNSSYDGYDLSASADTSDALSAVDGADVNPGVSTTEYPASSSESDKESSESDQPQDSNLANSAEANDEKSLLNSAGDVSGVEDKGDQKGADNNGMDNASSANQPIDGSGDAKKAGDGSGDKMVVNVNQIATASPSAASSAASSESGEYNRHYAFPSPLLLREGSHKISVDVEEQAANKERIKETLQYHGIPITNIEATVGPTVTLYEIRPEQGVKIAKIKNLADDIALSLSAIGVRIIAPIPGKGTVGIEVANNEPQTVSMRTIIMSRKYNETRYRLPVALGSTIGNDVYIADLTKMPHLLVAGATGQGKSVGLNAIIASLLYKKKPYELKFVMIDPKEVEFSLYAQIEKHYLAKLEDTEPIVTDMSKVVTTLQSLCVEMDNRYKLLRMAQVRNIEEYNTKWAQNRLSPTEGHKFLPYIVLVVDEFADLIMTSGKEVETPIARLAQKARAIGIHVIIATQRPSTNVITGIIKANFPVRIAFKVSSGVDSKTILDTTGAQSLIGKGDMLISNNSEMVRVQCAFIDTPEVEAICNYISRQPYGSGPYLLPEPLGSGDGDGGGSHGGIGERDPLFEEAGEYVVDSNLGSTSGIQRRFSIGYARAGKIMDQLEHYGVVGPSLGGKPRKVLMGPEEFRDFCSSLK